MPYQNLEAVQRDDPKAVASQGSGTTELAKSNRNPIQFATESNKTVPSLTLTVSHGILPTIDAHKQRRPYQIYYKSTKPKVGGESTRASQQEQVKTS